MDRKILIIIVSIILLGAADFFFWYAVEDRPFDGPLNISCISYDPYHRYFSRPLNDVNFTYEYLEHDMTLIKAYSSCVRIYFSAGGMDQVPDIARKLNMTIVQGAWLRGERELDRQEIDGAIAIAQKNPDVVTSLIIGNEVMLFKRMNVSELAAYISETQEKVGQPVSTAEPSYVWNNKNNSILLDTVDFIAMQEFPYWSGVDNDNAVGWTVQSYVKAANLSDKPISLTEVGWPSGGVPRKETVLGLREQSGFIFDVTDTLNSLNISYNVFEAFDGPWKMYETEGRVGAHWGLMHYDGTPKFSTSMGWESQWYVWAIIATLLALLITTFFIATYKNVSLRMLVAGQLVIHSMVIVGVFVIKVIIVEYLWANPLIWIFLVVPALFVAMIMLTQLPEVIEVLGDMPLVTNRRRKLKEYPFVSIHVPCCNEDPTMLKASLQSLLDLDYPNYEVIVVLNNTKERKLVDPVRDFCAQKGIRFFYLPVCHGFKSGALNYALAHSSKKAEIIAVIDADYKVDKRWLRSAMPYMLDEVAVVQHPQAYEERKLTRFQRIILDEYRGFFHIGMVQRGQKNAIIQHGTMTIIRKDVLEKVGRWSETSITEDAELGLSILEGGYRMVYVNEVVGRGVVPPAYKEYKKQRFRWAYGAVRILIKHWRSLFTLDKRLSLSQKISYVGGWLPWIGTAFYPVFTIMSVVVTAFIINNEMYFPPMQLLYPLFFSVVLLNISTYLTYRKRVGISGKRIFLSMVAGAALVYTVSRAVWTGLFSSKFPFRRTGKTPVEDKFLAAIWQIKLEIAVSFVLLLCVSLIYEAYGFSNLGATLWMLAVLIQAVPGLCSIYMLYVSEID